MGLQAPVAVFIFKRPDLTARVFEKIRAARPKTLLIVADGPRPGEQDEASLVQQTREVAENISWPCRVLRNFAQHNLGCKRRMSSGLDWVFENAAEAIILEDDCLPSGGFFDYCEQLLTRYRHDPRVSAISGTNVHCRGAESEYSYFFSKYFHCWGWASWRRVWQQYDVQMRGWPRAYRSGLLKHIADSFDEQCYWGRILDKQYRGQFDAWAYQMVFNCWQLGGLTALPAANLVSNIGFDGRGTHTLNQQDPLANCPLADLGPLRHPPAVERHVAADRLTFQQAFARDLRGVRKWRIRARHCWRSTLLRTWPGTQGSDPVSGFMCL